MLLLFSLLSNNTVQVCFIQDYFIIIKTEHLCVCCYRRWCSCPSYTHIKVVSQTYFFYREFSITRVQAETASVATLTVTPSVGQGRPSLHAVRLICQLFDGITSVTSLLLCSLHLKLILTLLHFQLLNKKLNLS